MNSKKSPWAWVPTLYFAEGLPNVVVMTVAVVMYMEMGMTDTEIALYTSWLGLPWVIKPLWSPFVDLFKTKRWWVLSMQLLLGAAFAGVAFTVNTAFWFQGTMFFFFLMAFSSATHDIAADGFYMLDLDSHDQSWFVGIRNTFYRIAVIFGHGVVRRSAAEYIPRQQGIYLEPHFLRTFRHIYRHLVISPFCHAEACRPQK